MFHDILKFSYFGTPTVGKKFQGHFWRNIKVPPSKIFGWLKKILAKKFWHQIWTNIKVPPSEIFCQPKKILAKKFQHQILTNVKVPPQWIFGWPKKNFSQKIPTPDLDKCKSIPPNNWGYSRSRYYSPRGSILPKEPTLCFHYKWVKMAAKGSEGPKLNKMPTLGLCGAHVPCNTNRRNTMLPSILVYYSGYIYICIKFFFVRLCIRSSVQITV